MKNSPQYIKLYSPCVLAKGYDRSMIYDAQYGKFHYIPNGLYDMLTMSVPISELFSLVSEEQHEILESYINFLEREDLAFFTDTPELFKDLDLSYETPEIFTNAIVDIDKQTTIAQVQKILDQLNDAMCMALQIRFIEHMDFEKAKEIIRLFQDSTVQYVEIYCHYSSDFTEEKLKTIAEENIRIQKFILWDSPESFMNQNSQTIEYTSLKYDACLSCGKVDIADFMPQIEQILESISYNSCLHRKIYVDVKGNLKHCPFSSKEYGNIKDIELKTLAEDKIFTSLWNIHKDLIDVCKDCEYRHICTDCRYFIKDPENIYSQPAKCGYNPYISKWETEEGYIPVEECGSYSKETGFIPDEEKITTLNQLIWEDE